MTDPDDSEHHAVQEEAVVVDTSDSSTVGAVNAKLPVQATAQHPRRSAHATASGIDGRSNREDETSLVRPYMLTGGRTKASYALELETLISAKNGVLSDSAPMRIEQRSIVEACSSPRSVAEIAVDLRMPLGVARVLVSDAADAGLVNVHNTVSGADGAEAHLLLMERVLSGLRRL